MQKNLHKTKKNHPIVFFGKYEVSILSDERLILPVGIINQFREHGLERILLGKYPRYKALILCPETLWSKWCDEIKKRFPCLKNHEGAKTFLIPWQPISWDTKGRISLPRRARDYAEIKANTLLIIIGMDYFFELWTEEEFNKITRECEIALSTSVTQSLFI